jgi:hypothetical protein
MCDTFAAGFQVGWGRAEPPMSNCSRLLSQAPGCRFCIQYFTYLLRNHGCKAEFFSMKKAKVGLRVNNKQIEVSQQGTHHHKLSCYKVEREAMQDPVSRFKFEILNGAQCALGYKFFFQSDGFRGAGAARCLALIKPEGSYHSARNSDNAFSYPRVCSFVNKILHLDFFAVQHDMFRKRIHRMKKFSGNLKLSWDSPITLLPLISRGEGMLLVKRAPVPRPW